MRVDVLLPQWGMGMSEGVINAWLKQIGDDVVEDEPIADVSAEKVDEELLAPATGKLVEILFEPGDTVEVRTIVAVIETA
jgi:pyruvate/2-oxoglutarate dehydrogenase complex dihydrolipoamide acyltransferase (E2) component